MLNIGFASAELTPDRPALLQGQMYVRVARAARDPLTATACAIEDIVLVSCDVIAITDALRQAVHARLPADLPADNVILCATHTHDSLVFHDGDYPHPGGDVLTPAECCAWAADRIAGAIVQARRARTPRLWNRAFGHAVIGHNRYAVYANGRGQMYGATNRPDFRHIGGYEDHSLDMLFIWEPTGQLAGLVLAVPCPAQVEEHLTEFSADYWHETRLELRRRFGPNLNVVGLCAPAGDQSPHPLLYHREGAEMRQRRGATERQEIALRLADAVERALACTKPGTDTPVFRHVVRELELPPYPVTAADLPWAQAQLDEWTRIGGDPNTWWPSRLRQVIETAHGRRQSVPVPVRIHALRLGNLAVATNPFELFLDYGLEIKARSPAAQTLLIQLTDGRELYLPTARAVAAGSYGAAPVVCPVGPDGGRLLVEETLTSLNEIFAAPPGGNRP